MKNRFWMFSYKILGILSSILFIYAGLYLMINNIENNIIFGIGLLGNIFGGWAFVKIIFEVNLRDALHAKEEQ